MAWAIYNYLFFFSYTYILLFYQKIKFVVIAVFLCKLNHRPPSNYIYYETLLAGHNLAVQCMQQAHTRLPFFKIFSNFVHFCPNFQIFCAFLSFIYPFMKKSCAFPFFLEQALFSVRVGFSMINKCHTLPIVYIMFIQICKMLIIIALLKVKQSMR